MFTLPGAGLPGGISLGAEQDVQILAGVGVVRLESQSFLELANCLSGAALLVQDRTQVIVGFGVVGLQA